MGTRHSHQILLIKHFLSATGVVPMMHQELKMALGGGGKMGITQFSGMMLNNYFHLVVDIFRTK